MPVGVKMRSEGGINGFLPRYFDQPALYRALALEQRCGYSGTEVNAGEEIDNRGSSLDRWAIGKAGRADQTRNGL
jgi:hypothetical protein